jgi:hypothetical protein
MGNSNSSTEVLHIRNSQLAKENQGLLNDIKKNIVLLNMMSDYADSPKKRWVVHKLTNQIYMMKQEAELIEEEQKIINKNPEIVQKVMEDHIQDHPLHEESRIQLKAVSDIPWNVNMVKDWYTSGNSQPTIDEIYTKMASFNNKHSVYHSMYPTQTHVNQVLRSFNESGGVREYFDPSKMDSRELTDFYPQQRAINKQLKSFSEGMNNVVNVPVLKQSDVNRKLKSFN